MRLRVLYGCLFVLCVGVVMPASIQAAEKPPLAPPEEPDASPAAPDESPAKVRKAVHTPAEEDSNKIKKVNGVAAKASAADGTYLFQYKFKPNQFVHYEVVDKMSITTQKGSVSQTATNESRTRKHYRVKSVDEEGTGVLEPTIDHVRMTAQFAGQEPVVYDSELDDAPPAQFLKVQETVGKSLASLKINRNGDLVNVSGLHPSLQSQRNETQKRDDEDDADDEKSQEGDTVRAPGIDPNLNFLVVFPEEAIRIGHTWKDRITIKVSVGGKLQRDVDLSRRYTLDKVEGDLATIGMQMSVLTPINDPIVRGQLIQRTPSGTIVFDMKQGLIVSRAQSLDKIEVGVAGNDSSVRALSNRTERMLSPAEVAERVATTASKDTEQE